MDIKLGENYLGNDEKTLVIRGHRKRVPVKPYSRRQCCFNTPIPGWDCVRSTWDSRTKMRIKQFQFSTAFHFQIEVLEKHEFETLIHRYHSGNICLVECRANTPILDYPKYTRTLHYNGNRVPV
jgi:hypothetical protein